MSRRKKIVSPFAHLYNRNPSYILENGKVVEKGEVIKIHGVHGTKFLFVEHVVRTDNGKEWIDCIELEKGTRCGTRSFYPDRIKTVPKSRRKIKKAD